MIDIKNKKYCSGCGACYNICPINCISMVEDAEGFCYPQYDKSKCINCNKCVEVCPMNTSYKNSNKIQVYAAKNKDKDIHFKSSSGGIFSILANFILDNKGIVYGAAFDKNFYVKHIEIENLCDLQKLRKAKYVQSDINTSFRSVKQQLNYGKKVLFSGTPCQIAGLKKYLNEDFENLYLIDIVCHGVPSPGVYRDYLNYLEKKYNSKIINVDFRAKELAIQAIKVQFENGEKYMSLSKNDLYYKAFHYDIILRPSCYECKHNNFRSGSDITIADYWGASTKFLDYKDKEEGVSLVITKTKKGMKLFNYLSEKFHYIESDINHATIKNPNIIKSSPFFKKRNKFFHEYKKKSSAIEDILFHYIL